MLWANLEGEMAEDFLLTLLCSMAIRFLCLIECQGAQHYIEVPYFCNAESLAHRQQIDEKKRQLCRDNNIRLIKIPYWDYDSLNTEYLFELLF